MKNIITISREFGSGGHFIGEHIAEELHIPFYDREIIFQVAQKTGLAETYIAEHGEYAPKGGLFSYSFVGRDLQGSSVDDYIYQAQQTILRELAQQESCVIIGRCADYILRDRKDVLNVFIYGEQSSKCRRIMELYQKTEKEALALMKETDKKEGCIIATTRSKNGGCLQTTPCALTAVCWAIPSASPLSGRPFLINSLFSPLPSVLF